jgi:hypothetical protein
MAKRQKVRYEFYKFEAPIGAVTRTLTLSNPASVKFLMTGSGGANTCLINNTYRLQPIGLFTNGTAVFPYELTLENNENELDMTDYVLFIQSGTVVVVAKYYID